MSPSRILHVLLATPSTLGPVEPFTPCPELQLAGAAPLTQPRGQDPGRHLMTEKNLAGAVPEPPLLHSGVHAGFARYELI